MTPDAPAADNAPLTIDQAIASLNATEKKDEAPVQSDAASLEGPNTEAEPAATDASEPETVADGDNAETEEGEAEGEPEQHAIEPPRFWDAEAKERFRELPRDLQELVLSKETERDRATSRAMQEAAERRKAADGEASRISQLNGVLDKLLPQAIETFKSRWDGVDWNAVVDQYGAEQALKLRNDFEKEQVVVQQLQAAKNNAEQVQYQRYVEAESSKLPQLCPELADAKEGPSRRAALGKFLIDSGVPPEAIRHISAQETAIAYDAMRWRQAQASAKAKTSAPPTPARQNTQPRPSVRPTASPARAPETARLKSLEGRFAQNPSIENLEALLNA